MKSETSGKTHDKITRKSTLQVTVDPWAIEWQCYLNWFAVVLMGLIIVMYLDKEVTEECWKLKPEILYTSYVISFVTVVEALLLYAAWILNVSYKIFHIGKVCFAVIAGHCAMAIINFTFAILAFLLPLCIQSSSDQLMYRYNSVEGIRKLVIKYETKVCGMFHVCLAVLLISSAMYMAKHRTDHKFRYLHSRGLLLEYFNMQD